MTASSFSIIHPAAGSSVESFHVFVAAALTPLDLCGRVAIVVQQLHGDLRTGAIARSGRARSHRSAPLAPARAKMHGIHPTRTGLSSGPSGRPEPLQVHLTRSTTGPESISKRSFGLHRCLEDVTSVLGRKSRMSVHDWGQLRGSKRDKKPLAVLLGTIHMLRSGQDARIHEKGQVPCIPSLGSSPQVTSDHSALKKLRSQWRSSCTTHSRSSSFSCGSSSRPSFCSRWDVDTTTAAAR